MFDGLGQDCINSIAYALELLQSCIEPMICDVATNIMEGLMA